MSSRVLLANYIKDPTNCR